MMTTATGMREEKIGAKDALTSQDELSSEFFILKLMVSDEACGTGEYCVCRSRISVSRIAKWIFFCDPNQTQFACSCDRPLLMMTPIDVNDVFAVNL
jgi:hypothetical protein